METKLAITGMTCGHCTGAVEKALAGVSGVTEVVYVDKDRNEALVRGTAAPEALVEVVAAEGYEVKVA